MEARDPEAIELEKKFLEEQAKRLEAEYILNQCRNELCVKCGNYRAAYRGMCNGCVWYKG